MANSSMATRIQRMKAVKEIQNLMGKYSYLYTAGMNKEVAGLFAQKTQGVRVTISDLGAWEGIDGIKRFYEGFVDYKTDDRIGRMEVYTVTTPLIEVAGDSKTGKAVWISPGALAVKDEQGKFKAYWHWVKGAADFIKENGKWRFWHYHMYTIFCTPFEHGWTEGKTLPKPVIPNAFKPDRPNTVDYPYSMDREQVLYPVPPDPYETFDEKTAY
jgi:hypothetical protein